jgi:mercuric ion binding protein
MKMQTIMLQILFVLATICTASAQKATNSFIKQENLTVSGECGMCKNRIEKTAIKAGAIKADWDENTKTLAVSYDRYKTSATSIEKYIAAVGYDTKNIRASNDSYNSLPPCCHYERPVSAVVSNKCCDNGMDCSRNESCCADGKCDPGSKTCASMKICKETGCCKS